MRTIRRILVAVKDPKSKSLPAVEKAAQLAGALNAELELFHSIATPIFVDTLSRINMSLPDLERVTLAQYARQLEGIAARLGKEGLKVSTCAKWDFPVYEAILRRALRTGADLIVAECHQGRHFAPGLLRLTDWELLRSSACPVLLVKNARPYRKPVVLAAIDPTHANAKPTHLDAEILQAGSTIQEALHGTLHAVHAYVPPLAGIPPSEYLKPELVQQLDTQAQATAKKGFKRTAGVAGIPPARQHLVGEHPVDAIPKTARETGSAIVVMGAISRSGIKRLFIGNTAEQLLDKLGCDVLIVKPRHFKNPVRRAARGVQLVSASPMIT